MMHLNEPGSLMVKGQLLLIQNPPFEEPGQHAVRNGMVMEIKYNVNAHMYRKDTCNRNGWHTLSH